jgi:hypothetical protein
LLNVVWTSFISVSFSSYTMMSSTYLKRF